MKIVGLSEEYRELYFKCLEDWSEDMKESGNHKACWYGRMKDKGLGVKLALDDEDKVGGMIQYYPSEYAPIQGENIYFIGCIWVHGHKKGRGNFQKKGMGKALLQAAEEDVRSRGAGGLAAWGLSLPVWMKASWYRKRGYQKVDKQGMSVLLWKPFEDDVPAPRWVKPKKKPEKEAGKVVVTAFINGWCPAQSISVERAKRAAVEFGDEVEFREINTVDRDVFLEWGIQDALYVDDKNILRGPPLKYEKIKKKMKNKKKKIKRP